MDDIQRAAINNRRGAAMVETALLCFFIYVPVLMMVIVWGDMTLDKQRAHMSAAYRAFKGEEADEDEVRQVFSREPLAEPTPPEPSDASR
ncbi:MAG: hypothetical protein ACOC2T_03280 [Planctomycetota bacterium]